MPCDFKIGRSASWAVVLHAFVHFVACWNVGAETIITKEGEIPPEREVAAAHYIVLHPTFRSCQETIRLASDVAPLTHSYDLWWVYHPDAMIKA